MLFLIPQAPTVLAGGSAFPRLDGQKQIRQGQGINDPQPQVCCLHVRPGAGPRDDDGA